MPHELGREQYVFRVPINPSPESVAAHMKGKTFTQHVADRVTHHMRQLSRTGEMKYPAKRIRRVDDVHNMGLFGGL